MGRFRIRNWPGVANKVVGFVALIVILIGARMTVWTEKVNKNIVRILEKQ